MSNTLNAYGMRPAYNPNGMAAARTIANGIASGYGTGLLKYSPVALNAAGQIVAATAGADFIGIFLGVKWIDASGIPHVSDQWIAGTTYQTPVNGGISEGYGVEVSVLDDPNTVYTIQANGSVAQGAGAQLNFANIGAGSTVTGLSAAVADASSISTTAQKQLRIVALDPSIGNAWGDNFTALQVQIAQHQYIANKVAV